MAKLADLGSCGLVQSVNGAHVSRFRGTSRHFGSIRHHVRLQVCRTDLTLLVLPAIATHCDRCKSNVQAALSLLAQQLLEALQKDHELAREQVAVARASRTDAFASMAAARQVHGDALLSLFGIPGSLEVEQV